MEGFKVKNPEYLNVPMTYAGRLDPMASGVLVVLAGPEIKNKEKYLALDKEYEFSILFGFSTDTYDILGKVIDASLGSVSFASVRPPARAHSGFGNFPASRDHAKLPAGYATDTLPRFEFIAEMIKKNLKYFRGKLKQKYPIYSSKMVKGKPLFSYARSGESVEIPERDILVKRLTLGKIKKIKGDKLFLNIEKRIGLVSGSARNAAHSAAGGDFRQKEILKIWEEKLLGKNKSQVFYIADFVVKCTSGTYVRGLANSLGEKIKVPALAFSIKRTKVGKFSI
ncbi:MAG: hypothetical protein NTW11_00645 [Candidatus Staskawiczbacteria bacterium]|nr:hypothetical protein [Candidatus Staskawiczbacteria bacterium]